MRETKGSHKHSRHLQAFILLFLKEKPGNGAEIMARMRAEMPYPLADSAGLYRGLQSLEECGAVAGRWDTLQPGAPRKVYTITAAGADILRDFADDIKRREANFQFFLKRLGSK